MTKIEFIGQIKNGSLTIKVIEGINYRDCEKQAKKLFKKIESRKVIREHEAVIEE